MSVTQGITERPVGATPEALSRWVNAELIPLLKQLRAEVNGITIPTSLPPSGAAGGDLAGLFPNPDVAAVHETGGPTRLPMGAVAEGEFFRRLAGMVVGGTPALEFSTEGSIFSMVGPGGASAPVVAYDFTRYNAALTVAQNLAAANQSGNVAYDLTAVGGAKIDYLALSGDTGQSPFAWTPIAASSEGGALVTGRQTDYVVGSGSPAGLQILGPLTVQWLGYITEQPAGAGDMFMWDFSAGGELEAANVLYLLAWRSASGIWEYLHEAGAGVDSTKGLLTNAAAQLADMLYTPAFITVTRSSVGSLTLYINGRRCMTSGTPSASTLPTGGTTSNLSLGFGHGTSKAEILGFRIFNVELTAAQEHEAWSRTFFGVSV